MAKELGNVKFYNAEKKFGFIKPQKGGSELYFYNKQYFIRSFKGEDLVSFERGNDRGKEVAVSVENLSGREISTHYRQIGKVIPRSGRKCKKFESIGGVLLKEETTIIDGEIEKYFKVKEGIQSRWAARKGAAFVESGGKPEFFNLELKRGGWKVYCSPAEKYFRPNDSAKEAKYAFFDGRCYRDLYHGSVITVTDQSKKEVGDDAENVFEISLFEKKEIFVEKHAFVTEHAVTNDDFADRGWRHATSYEETVNFASAYRVEETWVFTPKTGYEYLGKHKRTTFFHRKA